VAVEQKVSFCRICEAHCGMVATVEDDRITKLRPDPDHPLSKGYACPKGIAMLDVQNDPDRVTHPLKRGADGEFHRVSWEEALDDIGARLRAIIDRHGKKSVGWYMGNPGAFSYSHPLWSKGFVDALGSPHYYTAGSQDVNNRFAASALLYGSPLVVPIPDLNRTRFLFMVGANPMVSHGSVLTAPRIREQLHDIVGRGGRVVVVDPRRSETARQFEHVAITPDTDAWLLLSMLQVIFAEGLADGHFLAAHADGADALADMARPFAPEETEGRTGVPAETVRELARAMAQPGSAAYGRTGSCLGRFGTLVAFLIDALCAVTGNLDQPGGAVFGRPPIALDDVGEKAGLASYGKVRSRFGGFPDVIGNLPASLLPKEITTPGPLQIRALFVSAGNPVLSVPDGDSLEEALETLDLCVSLDFYVNETNRHADYVLPSPTFYERDDMPLAFLGFYTTPFIQYTDAVVPPAGEAREEWEVIDEIAKRIGTVPFPVKAGRLLGRLPGVRPKPRLLAEMLLRTGPAGDLFGLRRGGLNVKKLARQPHGIVLSEYIATGVLRDKVRHPGSRLQLAPAEIAGEVGRLASANGADPDFPLRLIGLRELRSHNSWMHNSPLLMRGGRVHALRVNPLDADAHGLADGDRVQLASKSGSVTVPVKVTDEMTRGTVALPHGWGHRGGWRVANDAGGVNVNLLASSAAEDLEPLAGMAFLNGIPVRLEPVAPSERDADAHARPAVAAVDL
jgi:formate dehydrogenase